MNADQIAQAVETGVAAGVAQGLQAADAAEVEKKKEFFVPREEHYKHHEFLTGLIDLMNDGKKTVFRAFLRVATLGILGLIVLGFIAWYKSETGG